MDKVTKRATWVKKEVRVDKEKKLIVVCSRCGAIERFWVCDELKYCYSCGARMGEELENDDAPRTNACLSWVRLTEDTIAAIERWNAFGKRLETYPCDRCGKTMRIGTYSHWEEGIVYAQYDCIKCKKKVMRVFDGDRVVVTAYADRTSGPWVAGPKPLTLDEVKELNGCPVWCEDRNGSGAWALVDASCDKCFDADYGDWEFYCYGWTNERGWRAWTSEPTDEERKAEVWKDD